MKLIVGLGNPGKQYENTRHNIGWMVLDQLAPEADWKESKKANAFYTKIKIDENEAELIKPTTYMNNSGLAVSYAVKKHNLAGKNIIVVHDDKDIELGKIKVQFGRGSAGHNGAQSVIDHLGTKDFTRVRVGIAPADRGINDTSDFVLGKFGKEEKDVLRSVIDETVRELKKILSSGE